MLFNCSGAEYLSVFRPLGSYLISRFWVSQVALGVKDLSASAGDIRDLGSIPGLGRSPGEVNGNPLQYFCLENSMDRGAWWTIVHRLAESDMTEATWHRALGFSCLTYHVGIISIPISYGW